jgi:predicted MPP superfamily phosphohydrolase
MRKTLFFLLTGVVLVAIYIVLLVAFPKNAILLPFLFILLLLDVYLWFSVRKKVLSLPSFLKYLVLGLYWLPFMMMVSSIITGMVIPFVDWNIAFRTYLTGFILVFYVARFFPALFLLIADIVRLLRMGIASFQYGNEVSFAYYRRAKALLITGWTIGGVLFMLLVYGMVIGNYDFQVKRVEIGLPELPSTFNDLRIVQLSDIHLGSWTSAKKLKEAVGIVNSLNPDVIFFTGDLLDYCTKDVDSFQPILADLHAPDGIYAILGNHDYGDYVRWSSAEEKRKDHEDLFNYYKNLGWKLLLNENSLLVRGTDTIAIIGVENWGSTGRFQRFADMTKALRGVEKVRVQLLLSHDPSHWEKIISKKFKNIDVTFSGHTHGFQFGIECCGIKWSPAQYMYKEWGGLYSNPVADSHPQYLYVNRGLGSIGYPGRVGIFPEITLIILHDSISRSYLSRHVSQTRL